MDSNLEELLHALNEHGVRYLVVGGYAVALHAQPRATKDLDVFIETSAENAARTYRALAQFGAPLEQFTVEDFADGRTTARFGVPPIAFDVLQKISGIDFDTAYDRSIEVEISNGLSSRYISADDFIANKLASGRPQDLADVEAVQASRRANNEV